MRSFLFVIAASSASGRSDSHRYKQDESAVLWVNGVGPYGNPQESYEYYELPYCAPFTRYHPSYGAGFGFNSPKNHNAAERWAGYSLRHSGYNMISLDSPGSVKAEDCTTSPLTKEQAGRFVKAVQYRWFYRWFLDDLPVWGMVGEMLPVLEKEMDDLDRLGHFIDTNKAANLRAHVYTSRNLIISYNNDQIVRIDLTSDPKSLKNVKEGVELTFTLFVSYVESTENFHSRFDRYLDHGFFNHPIRQLGIINSSLMALLLTILVALVFWRALKKDQTKNGKSQRLNKAIHLEAGEDGKLLTEEDSAGEQVHGDIFRAPFCLSLFAVFLGTGWQLIVLTLCAIVIAVLGRLDQVHAKREFLYAVFGCFLLSSVVAGYTSGQLFKVYHSTTVKPKTGEPPDNQWQINAGATVLFMPTVVCALISVLNSISLYYGTIRSVSFLEIFKLFFFWVLVSAPPCSLGTLMARRLDLVRAGGASYFMCCLNALPRPVPKSVSWYAKPQGLIPIAGFVSFSFIHLELRFILLSLWGYKYYLGYGYLLGLSGILASLVCVCSIVVVHYSLHVGTYQWQWMSFFSGASTGGWMFLYSIYHYCFRTQMYGFFQFSFYFGHMGMASIALGLWCGAVGHFAASKFVRAIFANIKAEAEP